MYFITKYTFCQMNINLQLHVSDLMGFGSTVAAVYNVQSIPTNFLIAPDGTIVEKNLRGEAVEQAVAKYIK